MRKIRFVILIIVFAVGKLMGQPDRSGATGWKVNQYYGRAGAIITHPGIFAGLATGINFGNQWGVEINAMHAIYKAKKLPANYKNGACLFGDCTPKDDVTAFALQATREFNLPNKNISVVLGAGPSYVTYNETQFSPPSSTGISFFKSSNYDTHMIRQRVWGLALHTRMLFRPNRKIAVGLGWFSNFNKARGIHGVEISLMAGRLRYHGDKFKPTEGSGFVQDSLRYLKKLILANDSIRTRAQRHVALRHMQFRSYTTPQLQERYRIAHDKSLQSLTLGGAVTGIGLITFISGIKNIPNNFDKGLATSAIGLTLGGTIGTVFFISSGRKLKLASRIKLEIKSRNEP